MPTETKGKKKNHPLSLFSDKSGMIRICDNAMTNEGRRRVLNTAGVRGAGILPTADLLLERASPGSPCKLIARVMSVDHQPTVVPFMPPRLETVFWSLVGSLFFFYSGD